MNRSFIPITAWEWWRSARKTPGATRCTITLGSTRQVTDDQGALTASYQYGPFGVMSAKSSWENGSTTSFLFAGEQLDFSNLYYLRARYYDPFTGRFTQMDPFPGITTLPDTLNPYLYTLNNPVNWSDS